MKESININSRVIERCLEGDIKAQYHLYKQYSKAMYNIAIRFLNNKMDAEDILQESFITAFGRLGELKNPDVFGSWLKRIVINKCISLQRKRKIDFEEIDEMLDISVSTSKTQYSRALSLLNKQLKDKVYVS